MAEKAGKLGAVYAAYGAGITVANEELTLVAGVGTLDNSNVKITKVTSDAGGNTPITKKWTCTVAGELTVEGGGTDTVYVTYKYWNEGVFNHEGAETWQAETEYAVGDRVLPTTPNNCYYEVAAGGAGESGVSEPEEWTTTVGDTESDGTVTWTCHSYFEVGQVAGFHAWNFNKVVDLLEATDYGDSGHKRYIAALKGWEGSAERHFLTSPYLEWLGEKVIIKFYVDVNNDLRYEGWGQVKGHVTNSGMNILVNETLSFEGDDQLSYENS